VSGVNAEGVLAEVVDGEICGEFFVVKVIRDSVCLEPEFAD